jgi:hypothetical protein
MKNRLLYIIFIVANVSTCAQTQAVGVAPYLPFYLTQNIGCLVVGGDHTHHECSGLPLEPNYPAADEKLRVVGSFDKGCNRLGKTEHEPHLEVVPSVCQHTWVRHSDEVLLMDSLHSWNTLLYCG